MGVLRSYINEFTGVEFHVKVSTFSLLDLASIMNISEIWVLDPGWVIGVLITENSHLSLVNVVLNISVVWDIVIM